MAYLIFTANGRELGRRPLDGPVDVGRSPECDVSVHDILLSRRHCRIESDGGSAWAIVDLSSKNGTRVAGSAVTRQTLADGDVVRIGKTSITFRAGAMIPAPTGKAKPSKRPADPWEAMNATVSGFDYAKSRAGKAKLGSKPRAAGACPPVGSLARFPTPQPGPRDPDSYDSEDVYAMLTELTSSSWDSIYLNASKPLPRRPAPRPMVYSGRHPRTRGSSPVDDSLQATAGLLAQSPTATPRPVRRRWSRTLGLMARGFAAVGQMVMIVGLLGKC